MENKGNNVEQQPKAETTKKNRAKSVAKTVLILAATALGVWYGKKGFKGMGNDVKAGFNKVTGAVKNAMPKKKSEASVEVEVREPRNEYRGHHGNNKNYNN